MLWTSNHHGSRLEMNPAWSRLLLTIAAFMSLGFNPRGDGWSG